MPIMRVLITLVFSLSCLQVLAAPSTSTTYETTPLNAEPDPLLTNDSVATMKKPPRNSLLLAAGYAGGHYIDVDEYIQGLSFVLRYAPLKYDEMTWDFQIEGNKENILGISGGYRWYYFAGNMFHPYLRASVGTFVDGFSELGGFADLKRWRVRGSAGIGDTFTVEAGVGYALNGVDVYVQAGYVFKF